MGKGIGFLLGAALGLMAIPALAGAPMAQVTGPIAQPDVPGTPTHNYSFFASNHDLASHGYVEEEYFIKGTEPTVPCVGNSYEQMFDGSPASIYATPTKDPAPGADNKDISAEGKKKPTP